ncbi:MAG: hypothetical protein IJ195_05255 [Lachnospiraceae bacterium]|nr:hypothetical protein [Lachnospiraceae bacterium]
MSKKKNKKNKNTNVVSEAVEDKLTGEDSDNKDSESGETESEVSESKASEAEDPIEEDVKKAIEDEAAEESEKESGKADEAGEASSDEKSGKEYDSKAREEYKKARLEQKKQSQEKADARLEDLEKSKEMDEKRLARRKRRIRNQVSSYLAVALFFLVVLAGGYFVLKVLVFDKKPAQTQEEVVATPEQQEQIDALVGEEEEIAEPEPEPEPEPVIDEAALAEAKFEEQLVEMISGMTLEQKVAGIILTSPEALTKVNLATMAGNGTKTALEKYQVGGLLYAAKNVVSKDQFKDMITGTAAMVTGPTFFAIAEEGGTQSPLAKAGFYEAVSSATDVTTTNDVQNAYLAGQTISAAMKELGLNLDLAPIADLSSDNTEALDGRTYGSVATESMGYVSSMEDGLESNGVTACLKYFPGQGFASSNPEDTRTVIDKTEDEFRSGDLLIYQASVQNGTKMIMISNAVVTAFDDSQPATFSDTIVTGILRDELGYNGVILSGNLSDKAIVDYYGADEAAIMALRAGCDMIVNPSDFEVAFNGIVSAVGEGTISEERINDALKRIYRIKYADGI